MEHRSLEQLRSLDEANVSQAPPCLSRNDRLARWAELLEGQPERSLSTFPGTEYQPFAAREQMRRTGSPISVALEDPLLRAEGLVDDTYGEARRFFDLSERQLHQIVCGCSLGETIGAAHAARLVRSATDGSVTGLIRRIRDFCFR
jgi:hypothetical protein